MDKIRETLLSNNISEGILAISTANLIILVTCILTLIYLFFSHLRFKSQLKSAKIEIGKITDYVACGIVILNFEKLTMAYANEGFYKMTGYTQDEMERVYHNDFFSLGKSNQISLIKKQLSKGSSVNQRFQMKKKSGEIIWVHLIGNVNTLRKKKTIYCVLMNITESVKYEETMRFNEERFRIASEVSRDILFEYDLNTDLMIFSERYYDMFGENETIENYTKYLFKSNSIYHSDETRIRNFIDQLRKEKTISEEFRMRDISGNYVWVQFKGRKVKGKDNVYSKVYGKLINVNNTKKELENLKQKSEIDYLTGLYNKASIREVVEENIKKKDTEYAIIVIDVDNFKSVNDTLGHQYGDYVLSNVAQKLQNSFGNDVIFGRIGGDEFVGYLPTSDINKVKNIAKGICDVVNQTYDNGEKRCHISASVGVAVGKNNSYDEVFKKADDALYLTKKAGKNSFTINDNTMSIESNSMLN